jgi:hypothetical protein
LPGSKRIHNTYKQSGIGKYGHKSDDETLPIINKPKHPKKGEYKVQNGRTLIQEDERTT